MGDGLVSRQLHLGGVSTLTTRGSRCSGAHRSDMPGWGGVGCILGMEHNAGKGLEARDSSEEVSVVVQCDWSLG